jgi:hypothetical protein
MTRSLSSLQTSALKKFQDLLSWNRFYGFLVLLPLFLSGCGGITIDKTESDLMPKTVAMSIFEKHGQKLWAEKPFMYSLSNRGEKIFIEFNQIDSAMYYQNHSRLVLSDNRIFGSGSSRITFENVTEAQALELTNAVRALGATSIDQMFWYKIL